MNKFSINHLPIVSREPKEPKKVLEEFFLNYHPGECRQELWEWFKLTVSGEFGNIKSSQRTDLISFYENLQQVIEAVYLLNEDLIISGK